MEEIIIKKEPYRNGFITHYLYRLFHFDHTSGLGYGLYFDDAPPEIKIPKHAHVFFDTKKGVKDYIDYLYFLNSEEEDTGMPAGEALHNF